ncbi:MAG: YcxB family protein [Clostridia bacterium]|nr:YcxB family protein [Clostridia bacterium]
MEPLFKTKTKCTEEQYKKFYKAVLKARHLGISIIVLELVFLIGLIIWRKLHYLLIMILFPIFFYIFTKDERKKEFNSNKTIQNVESEFVFYEDYFEEKTKYGEAKVKYKMLYKVIETKDNVYLMIGKSQGYILIKENMPKGLLEFINNKYKQ